MSNKRGKGGRRWDHNKQQKPFQDDHDYRIEKVQRRVTFKRTNHPERKNINNLAIRAHFEDTDMDGADGGFGEGNKQQFHRNRGGNRVRKFSPPPRGQNGRGRKLVPGATDWYNIIIPHGQKYEKDFILKSLREAIAPEMFMPLYFKKTNSNASFYVDDFKTAENLLNVDRKIQTPDGFRLLIIVKNSIPQIAADVKLKEKMKLAMVKRYNATTKALDLTKFYTDPDFEDTFCALFRPVIMLLVFDIISENIPDLEALNLNENKIHLLEQFKCLPTKIPNLKILYLAKNKITAITSLDALKALPLVEIVLEGNPVKKRYNDETAYISEVRKRLPKIMKLDGMDLPPPIGFDVLDTTLPPPKASFLCDPAGADIVRQFLEQYFIIFDSDNRQPLLDAYHEHAEFSLTATYSNTNKMVAYLNHSRNILRVRDLDVKIRHLKFGRLPVVSFLSELPATQHDPQSFCVDLSLYTPKLMLLTVTGIFKERNNKSNQSLRSFQRSLVIVPSGSGFCIRNEMLHINYTTVAQERKAFKIAPPAQQIQRTETSIPSTSTSTTVSGPPDEATKLQMIHAMSQQSNMNLEWSKKCLEETNWDYQQAGHVFSELHKQNKIPPEAFAKF